MHFYANISFLLKLDILASWVYIWSAPNCSTDLRVPFYNFYNFGCSLFTVYYGCWEHGDVGGEKYIHVAIYA